MTVVRFKESFENAERFVSKITKLRDRNFGSCVIDQVELVGNDWYQQQEKVKSIAKIFLSNIKYRSGTARALSREPPTYAKVGICRS